ncbi:metal ABC transporter solute-binding protein, Zn/Mn family [Streptomyces sp. Rer75]|uniref:metal ABC transporter solute-binding protein, Zn/Mn family n=1 Tax=Streptomyces sp. Rer75 TaxID=2750011 RepID=UPI0015CFDD79|nr:zinc ABC transporter substrate-binding protein [Streptomyces sp. Rer75]QLH20665.1 zinc ABC transporter substrate-binding protein [Streptomyces sp. Rer75]
MRSSISRRRPRALAGGVAAAAVLVGTSACSTASSGAADGSASGKAASGKAIEVVAAENFWGSIAQQLGGSHVHVKSIIDNPAADPHDYEPTAADGRAVATARYAIVNGIGYDAWADKLLSANPGSGRTELKVGDLVHLKPGGNPHRWYSPADVRQVIEKITADYKKIDPDHAASYNARKKTYLDTTLAPYNRLVSHIKTTYKGTSIGASESIATPLAQGLGLKMRTPASFLDAISEGTDPTAEDKSAIDRQIKNKEIKVYVYNSQNSTPDVRAQVKEAKAAGIPVATVTETPTPARVSFQDWQVRQLKGIERALAQAKGE